jgi:hypothetical protein
MEKHDNAPSNIDPAAAEPRKFEVQEAETDDLEVVEFDRAPLTDINFGF